MPKSDRDTDLQYGALPYRMGRHGVEILLITSRDTGRWVIPKGWPMFGKKPHRVAEIEAFQEAGVKGVIKKKPLGAYPYPKVMPNGAIRLCLVEVYPLRVTMEAIKWRESAERERLWFRADEAAELVDEGGLALLIDAWR
ncbi:NUDIX hydrolase [Acidisoma silvae]|uniref:NUDIX hydrolase n=1 Tax=Acidisoma silvae TaxID=2802396 RepID=A0A963YVY7_9PROT|nr:NUDIX hydrolase [Acidisoma silvae]MCB8877946.1 NUDIX hydrolase [Acidisoma silvae]